LWILSLVLFCFLILTLESHNCSQPARLINLLIISNRFFIQSSGFSTNESCNIQMEIVILLLFVSVFHCSVYFSCLMAWMDSLVQCCTDSWKYLTFSSTIDILSLSGSHDAGYRFP
jgi:hypothetical protein